MLESAFSGFSVDDLAAAQDFYTRVLGLAVEDTGMGLHVALPGGSFVFIYQKPDHTAASFTVLNFVVTDIGAAVNQLKQKGAKFEQLAGMTDESGIARGIAAHRGPDIAWFKDPAGNFLSVLKNG